MYLDGKWFSFEELDPARWKCNILMYIICKKIKKKVMLVSVKEKAVILYFVLNFSTE